MLRVTGLRKSFGPVRAVRDVSFSLARGRTTALIGENGAGKTTTLRIILGFLKQDAGAVETEAGRIGYIPDHPIFPAWTSGRCLLDLTGRAAGFGGVKWSAAARRACERLLFDPALLERSPAAYSAGNAKKFACLQSLAVAPDLLVVDEPFAALDPPSVRRLRELLAEARDGGTAVLLSSHMLPEIVRTSDDFIVLRRGEVAARSDLPEFLARFRPSNPAELESAFLDLMRA